VNAVSVTRYLAGITWLAASFLALAVDTCGFAVLPAEAWKLAALPADMSTNLNKKLGYRNRSFI
jgi:hypothetical protein